MNPDTLLAAMAAAGIVGRGGASFPTDLKWRRLKDLGRPIGAVVCNASEGEPSVHKDAYLLDHYPDRVVGGMVVAMEFLGVREAYFNINRRYFERYGRHLLSITNQITADRGWIFHYFIEEPSYIGGETGALLNAIEGRRTQPRLSPPSPSIQGIRGQPVLLDNVETFYDVDRLVTGDFQPTRLATVTGPVPAPGVYQVPRDSTVNAVLVATNNRPDFTFFAQVGGSASGEVINQEQTTTYELTGCGAIELYRADTPPYQILRRWFDFYAAESCGKCTPCREGAYQLSRSFAAIGPAGPLPWPLIRTIVRTMKRTSFCDLGNSLPVPVESYMKNVLGMEVAA